MSRRRAPPPRRPLQSEAEAVALTIRTLEMMANRYAGASTRQRIAGDDEAAARLSGHGLTLENAAALLRRDLPRPPPIAVTPPQQATPAIKLFGRQYPTVGR